MLRGKLNRNLVFGAIFLIVLLIGALSVWVVEAHNSVPLIFIDGVARNQTVKIRGSHFPANQTYTVRMGAYGGRGINGAVSSTTVNTGNGSFTADVAIPAGVHNMGRIAVRLENNTIYNSYNWFWNNTTSNMAGDVKDPNPGTGKPAQDVYTGIPTISIVKIEGENVTFHTNNFPPNQLFRVTMGSRASGGYSDFVTNYNSGDGTDQDVTVTIPARIAHYGYIWLRTQTTHAQPYSAWVGFFNPSEPAVAQDVVKNPVQGSPAPQQDVNIPIWHGTPTMRMCGVVQGNEVTFVTNNLTTNLDYTVRMNAFGTLGHNGWDVGTLSPGNDPNVRATFKIPAALAGHGRIAVRLDAGPYHAYNWFWNSNANVC